MVATTIASGIFLKSKVKETITLWSEGGGGRQCSLSKRIFGIPCHVRDERVFFEPIPSLTELGVWLRTACLFRKQETVDRASLIIRGSKISLKRHYGGVFRFWAEGPAGRQSPSCIFAAVVQTGDHDGEPIFKAIVGTRRSGGGGRPQDRAAGDADASATLEDFVGQRHILVPVNSSGAPSRPTGSVPSFFTAHPAPGRPRWRKSSPTPRRASSSGSVASSPTSPIFAA